VGKTTLVNILTQNLGLPLLGERARIVARSWGLTPAEIPNARMLEFQWELLNQQIEAEEENPRGFIADRCVIDIVAHTLIFADEAGISKPEVAHFIDVAARRLQHYDLVVFVPPMFPMVIDGERIADTSFQRALDQLLSDLVVSLDQYHCPGLAGRVHTIKSLSIADRVSEINEAIRSRLAVTA
jgi:hypothetical protein